VSFSALVPASWYSAALTNPNAAGWRFGWNGLRAGRGIPVDELLEAVDASYRAVLSKLPRKERPASAKTDGPG
jgi:hypothetical protein